jgi:hypothetical protein
MGGSHRIHDSSKVSSSEIQHTAKAFTHNIHVSVLPQRCCFGYHGGVLADIPIHGKQLISPLGMPCFTVIRYMALRVARV